MSADPDHSLEPLQAAEFVRLLAKNERQLAACVFALVPNFADADDILQDTKLALWQQFGHYDPGKDFGDWARTIARYQIYAHRHRSGRKPIHFGEEFLQAVTEEVAAADQSESQREALSTCLKRMRPRARTLLMRSYASGASLKKIATELGRTPDSLYKTLGRIRRSLSNCMKREIAAEEKA